MNINYNETMTTEEAIAILTAPRAHYFRTATFTDESGETLRAICCVDRGAFAIETKGDIITTDTDTLTDVLSGTPWADWKTTYFVEDWEPLDKDVLNSAGLRAWIAAKEQGA